MREPDVSFAAHLPETVRVMVDMGLFLVSGTMEEHNVMTIGWGTAGIVWARPVFIVLVRPSRYTYGLVEQTGEFTVNVPTPNMRETVLFCGTVSGRDHDKWKERDLSAVPASQVNTPVIGECPVHYECRVIHSNDVIPAALAGAIPPEFYPEHDYHRVYFGEIVATSGDGS